MRINKPHVSVIVPVYKIDEILLRHCMQSLTDQTETSAEFIIVDDGSPDNCGEIVDEYADKDERFIAIHTPNQGVSVARNTGLDQARGEYIIFVDGDDWVEPDMCQKVVHKMQEAGKDILFFMHLSTAGKVKNFIHDETLVEIGTELFQRIHYGIVSQENPINGVYAGAPWGKVYRRSIIEDNHIRFVPGLKKCQDRVFVFDYMSVSKSASLYRYIGYHYVVNGQSVCHKYNREIVGILNSVGNEFNIRKEQITPDNMEKYNKALMSMRIAFFYECMLLNFFHRDNPDSFGDKLKGMKNLLSQKDYSESIRKGSLAALKGRKRKLAFMAIRLHLYPVAGFIAAHNYWSIGGGDRG